MTKKIDVLGVLVNIPDSCKVKPANASQVLTPEIKGRQFKVKCNVKSCSVGCPLLRGVTVK